MFASRKRRGFKQSLVLATTLMLLCGSVVRAQDTASLSGTVTDPQGKVIPGATITITNNATGASRNSRTGDEGTYIFTQAPPGTYKLRVSNPTLLHETIQRIAYSNSIT